MVLYSLHVFDRSGRCLFDREWNGPRRDDGSGEHPRLVFGMLHSLGEVSNKLAPRGRAPDGHITVRTDTYALHAFEALSGYRLLCSRTRSSRATRGARAFPRLRPARRVECVVKSPVQDPTAGGRVAFGSPLFEQLHQIAQHMPLIVLACPGTRPNGASRGLDGGGKMVLPPLPPSSPRACSA